MDANKPLVSIHLNYKTTLSSNSLQPIPDATIYQVNREELYKGCVKVDELDSFLGEFGFSREVTDWEGQTWGDAFYLKRE